MVGAVSGTSSLIGSAPTESSRSWAKAEWGSSDLAEQERPIVRTVALKVVKLGMDSREVLARFDSERLLLARMAHPNIARVLDAGTSEDAGRPYFVMDYIAGVPITQYCDANHLPIRERLALFIPVCGPCSTHIRRR